jgi:ferrochelatase
MCPAFVADCLETLEEISVEGRATFLAAGGQTFRQIPCLNEHPAYIDFLVGRVARWQDTAAAADAQPEFADAMPA